MELNKEIIEKIRSIKAILTDVDGVLTDGGIIFDNKGNELKKFNVKDGQIIKHLKKNNYIVGVITGRKSDAVIKRCKELEIPFHKHGINKKIIEYNQFKKLYNLNDKEIIYIGDDINDLCVLKKCGLAITPADASSYVKEMADITTESKGGKGVLREVADAILKSNGKLKKIIKNEIS